MNKRWLLAIALIVLGAVVVMVARHRASAPVVQAKSTPAQAKPASIAGSGVLLAAEVHARLLAEAQQLPEPTMASANAAHVPGQVQAAAVDSLNQQKPAAPSVDDLPPEQQVFVGFTANVIGETDPCG